jgi:hypothetical protein
MKIYEHMQGSGFISVDATDSGVSITTRTSGKQVSSGMMMTAGQARDMAQSILDAVPAPAPAPTRKAAKK